jgi:hypothetical protein
MLTILQKCDINGQHKTLYKKDSPPNPTYSGVSIFELMKSRFPDFLEKEHENSFTFDGDSIEIITQNFYKTNIKQAVAEHAVSEKSSKKNYRPSLKK